MWQILLFEFFGDLRAQKLRTALTLIAVFGTCDGQSLTCVKTPSVVASPALHTQPLAPDDDV